MDQECGSYLELIKQICGGDMTGIVLKILFEPINFQSYSSES